MAFIVINDDKEMRENMRQQMRGGYRRNMPMRRNTTDQYEEGYRNGYTHGWQDAEDESDTMMNNRRGRGRDGRFM